LDSPSEVSAAGKEAYFVAYAKKASKMKDWQLVGELANKVTNLDDLAENPEAVSSDSSFESSTSRQIEILMKENQRRKKI
jgi:CTP:phosphocholine cytidylyltransferase-like protein